MKRVKQNWIESGANSNHYTISIRRSLMFAVVFCVLILIISHTIVFLMMNKVHQLTKSVESCLMLLFNSAIMLKTNCKFRNLYESLRMTILITIACYLTTSNYNTEYTHIICPFSLSLMITFNAKLNDNDNSRRSFSALTFMASQTEYDVILSFSIDMTCTCLLFGLCTDYFDSWKLLLG